jgi:uncharacterized protein
MGRLPGAAILTPFRATAGGTSIAVRVQPRASRSEIAGLHGSELRIRLTAPPVDGAANDALIQFLAGELGVARSELALVSGASSRSKVVLARGITPAEAATRLRVGD